MVEMVRRVPALARVYAPGSPLDARRRELVAAVVAGAAGAAGLTQLHAGWHDLLGPAELDEVDDEVLAWAVDSVGNRPEVDLDALPGGLSDGVRDALAAVVAYSMVSAAAERHGTAMLDAVRGRTSPTPGRFLGHVVGCAIAAPLVAPMVAVGGSLALIGRITPAPVPIELDSDPNLLAQLLAETLPMWLGGAWGRTLVARLPVEVPVAWRSGLTGATVRIGRGRIQVANGLASDAWALFDGEIDSLLRAGSQSLSRELRADRLER